MNYGFIGTGNISRALVGGALRSQNTEAGQFYVFDVNDAAQSAFVSDFGVNGCSNTAELIRNSDVVFLTVKPTIYPKILPAIKNDLRDRRCPVVSPAAGRTLASVEEMIGEDMPLIRVMPNLNAAVCEAITAVCANKSTGAENKRAVMEFFSWTGRVMEIDESLFPIFTALTGCSPAFTYLYVDSLAKGALKNGINKKQALEIAAQAVIGSAKMVLESGKPPGELIDSVCSPGGTTIEGMCVLDDFRFQSAVVHAMDASIAKDEKIQG